MNLKQLCFKTLFVLILFLGTNATMAQKITGTVVDEEKNPLEFVSVALLMPQDSTLVKYTSTDKNGKYELNGVRDNTYLFQIYFMTYQANQRTLVVKGEDIDLGITELEREVNQLDEVVVKTVIPITIKQDTMAFNANAFKVRQDDNVEDLVRKLPGVEIGTDGTVSAQGEEVNKILVDGKEFFTNDPTIALKNLNADAVKSVQIIDEESDEARTTGIKDGEKTKIINLVLKEGKKSGYFGKVGAGYGTNDRYTSNLDVNRFTKKTQTAIFGSLNNINNTGATVFRRDGSRNNSNSGLLTTGTAGANFNYEIAKDYDFNIDYNYGYSDSEEEERTNRTEFTNDSQFSTEEEKRNENTSNNHNVNFSLRNRSKEGTYMEFRGNFKNDRREAMGSNSKMFFDEDGNEDTSSDRNTSSDDLRNNGSLRFSMNKKLNESGRNFRLRAGMSFQDFNDMNFQRSLNMYELSDPANSYEEDEVTTRDEERDGLDYNMSFRWMEPLVQHHLISFETSVNNENDTEDVDQRRTVNDVEENPFIYYLDHDKQVYLNQLGYVFSKNKIQVYVSAGWETMKQNLDVDNVRNVIDRTYDNFLPRVTANYEWKKGKRLRLRYNKSTTLPNANQVSPVINDFNPLRIFQGNTELTPEISNNYNLMYYNWDFKRASNFFGFINYSTTSNAIVNSTSIDENYVSYNTFENFGDRSNLRARISMQNKFKGTGIRYSIGISGNIDDYTTIINDEASETKTRGSGFNLSFSNDNKNKLDVVVGARIDINKTTYSINDDERDFFQQNYYTKFDWDITPSLNLNTQFDYNLYTDNQFDSQDVPIWNVGVEYAFLNGKRGNLKLQVFDILDENIGIVRTSSANYFEETFQKNLGTYAMLSFTYNLKPPQGKSSKRDQGRGRWRRH